jgi:nitroreductase
LTVSPVDGEPAMTKEPEMQPTVHASIHAAVYATQAAAELAGYAPSVHNSQPWRWRVGDHALDLYADARRQLGVTDPDARLATLSCGAALHHARVALAAEGWRADVVRLPDPADPGHFAHLSLTNAIPVAANAVRDVQSIRVRHTDRRPVSGTRLDADQLRAIVAAVEAEGARLHVLSTDGVLELAAAASFAQRAEAADDAWQAELAYWTGGSRPTGAGVPDSAIPDSPTLTTVPGRDFGHPGTLPVNAEHDAAATFAILYGDEDTPGDWLRAGEALSAGWLAAATLGVSVLPMSATVEVAATRATLRRMLSGLGEPFLVLRLGIADPDHAAAPHTPRLPARQTIERG